VRRPLAALLLLAGVLLSGCASSPSPAGDSPVPATPSPSPAALPAASPAVVIEAATCRLVKESAGPGVRVLQFELTASGRATGPEASRLQTTAKPAEGVPGNTNAPENRCASWSPTPGFDCERRAWEAPSTAWTTRWPDASLSVGEGEAGSMDVVVTARLDVPPFDSTPRDARTVTCR
jgi:hypothetical protein